MTLAPGTRVGNYEVAAPLGAGGMGEVYRARDVRLERAVAIKSLPGVFAGDVERLGRLEREAKMLASLNHPNIATLYGIEEAAGSLYLVMEFVAGETLAQRLARGPLSARETIEFGRQIAGALEAAHDGGIVHRDLKPANVMLSAAGPVKVLDFGLAKGDGGGSASGVSLSLTPTVAAATADGIILGTAPYMSPEQARGRAVDRRADVWAFGCVLYECLTGRMAFAGETPSDVIARILEREPDWTLVPVATPARLRDLVRRCLTRELEDRPRDVGDLRRELSAIANEISGRSSAGERPAGPARPSLAVLYFENLANDPESEYFCSGITEDILTDLSKIQGLRVASRNAIARYRGKPADPAQIAADLGVTAVLGGSVRRAGGRVRISAQLVNAADGFQLWAERYDRTLEDVFAVQEEIAAAIASALRVAMTPSEAQQLQQDRPADVRAYDLYLKGRAAYGLYTRESLEEALDLFRQATAVDPAYARAFAGIADCYGQLLQWNFVTDRAEATRLGLEAARHAIALNPRLAEAHKAESLVLRNSGDIAGSRAALDRALEADPRHVPSLINMAVHQLSTGHVAGAERSVRSALVVDPQEPFATTWLSWLMLLTERLDESLSLAARLRRLSDQLFYVTASHGLAGMCHLRRNDDAALARTIEEAHAEHSEAHNLQCLEAAAAARAGRTGEALALLRDAVSSPRIASGNLMLAGAASLRAGDPELAMRFVNRNVVTEFAGVLIRLDSDLHALLDRPPFAPRRSELALVWPLEAPMMSAAVHATFREVRIESGRPPGGSSTSDA